MPVNPTILQLAVPYPHSGDIAMTAPMSSISDLFRDIGIIASIGTVFVALGVALILYRVNEVAPKPISAADLALLGEIRSAFSRQAFAELVPTPAERLEDLRAMFSAFNETRVILQRTQEKIDNRIVRGLLKEVTKRFIEIQQLSPWAAGETGIGADRKRLKRDDDRATVARWARADGSRTMAAIVERQGRNDAYRALYLELLERRRSLVIGLEQVDYLVSSGLLDEPSR